MNTVRLWEGAIQTRIVFGSYEYQVRLRRLSYFPLHYPEIVDFFSKATQDDHSQQNEILSHKAVWLEHNKKVLKWNLPIGVIYDMCHILERKRTGVPTWVLTLMTASNLPYPADEIIPFPISILGPVNYADTFFQTIINLLKQSCYVLTGSSRPLLSLSEDHTKRLWKAIQRLDYDEYQSAINKSGIYMSPPRRIPVKVSIVNSNYVCQVSLAVANDGETKTSLAEALAVIRDDENQAIGEREIYIQGIDVRRILSEDVQEVWRELRHLDNFLYVIVL